MKPALQMQFFLGNDEHTSASLWISDKEDLKNWLGLVMMITTRENQFPVQAIYVAALDEQYCNCLN